jgi:phosphopantothenoylcysteine synthetase/decarboxylase
MRVLYVIACGAGPAPDVGRLVGQAQQRGWDVHLIATPAAVSFLDIDGLEARTGHAVRSEYRGAGTSSGRSLPRADAIVVAPATYNTINKWAMGVSDNYALGILAESVGLAIPTVVLPFVNAALAAHPAFQHSVAMLRDARVAVLLGPGEFEPHPPGTGADRLDAFPWHRALDRAEALTAR